MKFPSQFQRYLRNKIVLSRHHHNESSCVHNSWSLSDHQQSIYNLLNQFLWCIDTNDFHTFSTLFHNNGRLEIIKMNKILNKEEELQALCSNLHNRFSPALHFVRFFLYLEFIVTLFILSFPIYLLFLL